MKRVFSILLSLFMLVSNVGFSINTHFCGGIAVKSSLSVGLHNPDCGMSMMDDACDTMAPLDEELVKSKPCCENQHQLLQLDENAKLKSFSFGLNPAFFLSFIQSFVHPITFADQNLTQNTYYPPPIPDKDIQILFQSFLI